MADTDRAQICLITPPEISLSHFPDVLVPVMDAVEIACLRLALSSTDPDHIARAGDACREVAHERDVAIVIENHVGMVARLGLDGVHLTQGGGSVRDARHKLDGDAIVGSYCGSSRHNGVNAAEAGADYVCFGPLGDTGLGHGNLADRELFSWWSEMIVVPVVAEGGLNADLLAQFAPITDFFAIGPEIWLRDDPALAIKELSLAY